MKGTVQKKKVVKINREYIMLAIAVIAVLIVSLWYAGENYSLKVWGDEFGYWQSAAFLNGKDWSSVASTNGYYGYGFGILLAPIMAIWGENSTVMLQAALTMEAVMLSSCVVAAYLIISHFCKEVKGIVKVLMAVLPIVYPGNILNVNLTMAEILLVTLIWWYSWIVIKFVENQKISQAIVILLMSIYMYSVHQRTIAIIAISVLLILCVYRKQLLTPKTFIALGVLIVGILLVLGIKEIYVNSFYSNVSQTTYSYNNLSGQTSKLLRIFTSFDYFTSFLLSLIGKLYYAVVASCLLLPFGLYKCYKYVIESITEKKISNNCIITVTLCLNFLAAYLIAAIYMYEGVETRTDMLIYGRYIEHTIGPMILLGLIYLYKNKANMSLLVVSCSAFILTFITQEQMYANASNDNIWLSCCAIADLFGSDAYGNVESICMALFRSVIIFFAIALTLRTKSDLKNIMYGTVLFIVCCMWINTGYAVRNDKVISWADKVYEQQMEVLTFIDETEFGLYDAYLGGFFQFLRTDSKVNYFSSLEEIKELDSPMYIITYAGSENASEIRNKEEVVVKNKRYILWRYYPE